MSTTRQFFLMDKKQLDEALKHFINSSFKDGDEADAFFRKFGVGNTVQEANFPYERFCDYQSLLETLQAADSPKFEMMHKGLPYYFMFWTAYDCRIYDKALFYLDAAVSEDIRTFPRLWFKKPATENYLLLNEDETKAHNRVVAEYVGSQSRLG